MMDSREIPRLGYARDLRIVLFGLLSIAGLSFWFFLGFPFANHNESYIWIVQLDRLGFVDVLSKGLRPVSGFRPLGVVTAWLGYRLSGNSIYLQQVLNYLGAAIAWLILFSTIKQKRLFGWVAILVGGTFFSGYLYLFHLHGVFYSPPLMFLAFLLASAISHSRIKTSWLVVVSALAVVASLYHPFAIAIYIAFMLGHFLENLHLATRRQLVLGGILLVASYGLMRILVPTRGLHLTTNTMVGLLASYKMVEFNLVLSFVSWLLSIVTVISLNASWRVRTALGGVITVLSLAFVSLSWPVVIIWIAVSLLKSILMKKWSIAFIIITTAMLPAATATGSPGYSIFVLMACSLVVPLGYSLIEINSFFHDSVAIILIGLAITAAILLKTDTRLPIVSRLANPLLAEKEKTFQMEEIIRWMISSDFKEYRLVLCEDAENPATAANAIDRKHRPPTSQKYLGAYIDSLRMQRRNNNAGQLMVCFGGAEIDSAEQIYTVAGDYNGEAIVWKQSK
jgi:hypothetical protein